MLLMENGEEYIFLFPYFTGEPRVIAPFPHLSLSTAFSLSKSHQGRELALS